MPKRIQRKRTKGWRMPEGALYVGRPTRWGNPFIVGRLYENYAVPELTFVCTMDNALEMFRHYCEGLLIADPGHFTPLAGKDLACFCKEGAPCHADILLRLANQPPHRSAANKTVRQSERGDATVDETVTTHS